MKSQVAIDSYATKLLIKIKEYLWLMRPFNLVHPFIFGLTGAIFASWPHILISELLAASLIPVAGWAIGQYFNDIVGVPEDKINHPYRAIPSGKLAKQEVLAVTLFIGFLGVLFSFYYLGFYVGLVTVFVAIVCYLYPYAKKYGVWGSFCMSALMGSPIIFGNFVVNNKLSVLTIIAYCSVFIYEVGNNIMFTYDDHEGESAVGIHTLPLQIGLRPAAIVAAICVYTGAGLMLLPWALGILSWHYLLFYPAILYYALKGTVPVIKNPNAETGYKCAINLINGFIWGIPIFLASVISPIIALSIIVSTHLVQNFFISMAHKKEQSAS